MNHFLIRILFASVMLVPIPAFAASDGLIVSLATVGERIRAQNPDLIAARLRIREAAARVKQAGRLANPDLDIEVEHNGRIREGGLRVGISQKFPVTDRLTREKEVSIHLVETAKAEVREVERKLVGDARTAMVKILALRQQRGVLRQQVEVSGRLAEFIAKLAEKGEGSPLDAGRAKLDSATLQTKLRQLDAEEAALTGELKPLLGMTVGSTLNVSGELPEPHVPSVAADPSKRPDYQAALSEVKAAEQGIALEYAKRYDDFEAGVFAGVERSEDVPEGYETEGILGFRLKIPLPLRNRNEAAIEEAQAKHERKQKEAVALARNIRLEVDATRAEMDQWAAMIREIRDNLLPLADQQADASEQAYRNGQEELQSVLRARDQRLQLAASRVDALREFHLARARYEAALNKQ